MERSRHCDNREHEKCDGSVTVMDQDGASRYVCGCHCHNTDYDERDCRHCNGTGKVHENRSYGRFTTQPGPIPTPASTT